MFGKFLPDVIITINIVYALLITCVLLSSDKILDMLRNLGS